MTTIGMVLRMLVRVFRSFRLRRRIYSIHGLLLPAGAVFRDPENVRIGRGFMMSEQCSIFCQDPERGSSMEIGDDVKLNTGVMLNADCGGRIKVGNRVLIGPYVVIRAANHATDRVDIPIAAQGHVPGEIVIEDDVWIGAHAVILPGARIGRGAVVAAASVVTRDVAAFAVVAGAPAAVLRRRGG
jgi:galactoside O-acetyltransferase